MIIKMLSHFIKMISQFAPNQPIICIKTCDDLRHFIARNASNRFMSSGKMDDGYAQLFEQFGHKLTQIDAPITPNMPSFGLHIGVFEALTIKIMAQIGIALIEEIGATYAYPK